MAGCLAVGMPLGVSGERYDAAGIGQRGRRRGYCLISRGGANDHGEAAEIEIKQAYLLAHDGKRFLTVDLWNRAGSRPCGDVK